MKEAKPTNWNLSAKVEWDCPDCGYPNITEFSINPYRALAESPPDEMCEKCEEFFTLSFYE